MKPGVCVQVREPFVVGSTSRGFELVKFVDAYNVPCQLQQRGSVYSDAGRQPGTSAVWLGESDAQPKVLASEAASVGVKTDKTCGWVPYPMPANVLVSTRMHLDRDQAQELTATLLRWLRTGSFEKSDGVEARASCPTG